MGCGGSIARWQQHRRDKARHRRIDAHRKAVIRRERYASDQALDDPRVAFTVGLLSELPTAVLLWADGGELLHANPAALELLDHDGDSLRIGNHVSKLLDLPEAVVGGDWTSICYQEVDVLAILGGGTTGAGALDVRLYTTAVGLGPAEDGTPPRMMYCGMITPQHAGAPAPLLGTVDASAGRYTSDAAPADVPMLTLSPSFRHDEFGEETRSARGSARSGGSAGPDSAKSFDTPSGSPVLPRSPANGADRVLPAVGSFANPPVPVTAFMEKRGSYSIRGGLGERMGSSQGSRIGSIIRDRKASQVSQSPVFGFHSSPTRGSFIMNPSRRVHFNKGLIPEAALPVMDAMQQPVMVLTNSGLVIHWNPSCSRVFGPTSEDMLGHSVTALVPYPFSYSHDRHIREMNAKFKADEQQPGRGRPGWTQATDRLSVTPRAEILRTARDVVGRTLPASGAEDDAEFKSLTIPLRVMLAELPFGDPPYWLCICAVAGDSAASKSSLAHRQMLESAQPNHKDHPPRLPDERPTLDVASTPRSICGPVRPPGTMPTPTGDKPVSPERSNRSLGSQGSRGSRSSLCSRGSNTSDRAAKKQNLLQKEAKTKQKQKPAAINTSASLMRHQSTPVFGSPRNPDIRGGGMTRDKPPPSPGGGMQGVLSVYGLLSPEPSMVQEPASPQGVHGGSKLHSNFQIQHVQSTLQVSTNRSNHSIPVAMVPRAVSQGVSDVNASGSIGVPLVFSMDVAPVRKGKTEDQDQDRPPSPVAGVTVVASVMQDGSRRDSPRREHGGQSPRRGAPRSPAARNPGAEVEDIAALRERVLSAAGNKSPR